MSSSIELARDGKISQSVMVASRLTARVCLTITCFVTDGGTSPKPGMA